MKYQETAKSVLILEYLSEVEILLEKSSICFARCQVASYFARSVTRSAKQNCDTLMLQKMEWVQKRSSDIDQQLLQLDSWKLDSNISKVLEVYWWKMLPCRVKRFCKSQISWEKIFETFNQPNMQKLLMFFQTSEEKSSLNKNRIFFKYMRYLWVFCVFLIKPNNKTHREKMFFYHQFSRHQANEAIGNNKKKSIDQKRWSINFPFFLF